MLLGYLRVATLEQSLDLQTDALSRRLRDALHRQRRWCRGRVSIRRSSHPGQAKPVKLRCFFGLTNTQAANVKRGFAHATGSETRSYGKYENETRRRSGLRIPRGPSRRGSISRGLVPGTC